MEALALPLVCGCLTLDLDILVGRELRSVGDVVCFALSAFFFARYAANPALSFLLALVFGFVVGLALEFFFFIWGWPEVGLVVGRLLRRLVSPL